MPYVPMPRVREEEPCLCELPHVVASGSRSWGFSALAQLLCMDPRSRKLGHGDSEFPSKSNKPLPTFSQPDPDAPMMSHSEPAPKCGRWRGARYCWPLDSATADVIMVGNLPALAPGDWHGETCADCLGELLSQEDVCRLPCHDRAFHRHCLVRWLAGRHVDCPSAAFPSFE
eukprot:TRINITY_DN64121_c0_g1_i1.p2 TRINITY_DN64121_c0_g1~~TRINITY_DN64121_c0_g1_i1.p2  ORF type:complete len:172 (+),score=15.56 TRINITY_DN64121_c0_g1_i1:46-561(+)